MRSCAALLRGYRGAALFSTTHALLGGGSMRNRKASATATPDTGDVTLASFLPAVAATWMTASSNKMLQPHHVAPDSRKLAWWCCPGCQHQFTKRIDLHVAAGGACPKCLMKPSAAPRTGKGTSLAAGKQGKRTKGSAGTEERTISALTPAEDAPTVAAVAHRTRPSSSQATLAAENANRVKKSVADGSYLRQSERRNLMPMLAKNYEKEGAKIGASEIIAVSPKLDGIRCVTAYDAKARKILFFSRAGTLFECCDAKIEPYLQPLFEADPSLVLDGELYNDSANLQRMTQLLSSSSASSSSAKKGVNGGDTNGAMISLFAEQLARVNPYLPAACLAAAPSNASARPKKSSKTGATSEMDEVVSFDQLTSAIRTTRERRTPTHEALQRKLQYHIFDLLYSEQYPTEKDSQPFRTRYHYLAKLLTATHAANMARANVRAGSAKNRLLASPHALPYDPRVLRLVPSLFCTRSVVDGFLRAAMAVGYEGIMLRRDGVKAGSGHLLNLPSDTTGKGPKSGKGAAASLSAEDIAAHVHAAEALVRQDFHATSANAGTSATAVRDGGYGYGQRSSTLLKYKVMQDSEFVIVAAVEGKGKWEGCLGAFVCQTPDKKRTFTVTPASTDAQKKKMWATWEKAYKGKALTVQYQELTSDGIPRFPVGKAVRGAANGQDWI